MTDAASSQLFLGRQPILDRDQKLFAYELLFRSAPPAAGNQANVLDATEATATVISNTFAQFSSNEVLGGYRGFINIDYGLLFNDVLEALPTHQVVLEILENIEPTPEVIARCKRLKELGFMLAVDDIVHANEAWAPLFNLSEIIKIDIMGMSRPTLTTLANNLRPYGKKLLAEKVETTEQHNFCKRLGFDLFQGYYFAKPTIIVGKKLSPSQIVLMRLISLIMKDADTGDLEEAFKLEPVLTLNLLRLTNSASNGLSVKITSIMHAITVLGRKQLQRWIQLLIYTNSRGGQEESPILQLAATRGRLMELLAGKFRPGVREFGDQSFMVGIMSLMPVALNVPMDTILTQLPVSQRIRDALSVTRAGELGQLLKLVEATEKNSQLQLDAALAQTPAISAAALNQCLVEAFSFGNNIENENKKAS